MLLPILMIVPPMAAPRPSSFFWSIWSSVARGTGSGTWPSTDGNKTATSIFKIFSPPMESPSILASEAKNFFSFSELLSRFDLLQVNFKKLSHTYFRKSLKYGGGGSSLIDISDLKEELMLMVGSSKTSSYVKFTNIRAFVNQIKQLDFFLKFFLNEEGQLSKVWSVNT